MWPFLAESSRDSELSYCDPAPIFHLIVDDMMPRKRKLSPIEISKVIDLLASSINTLRLDHSQFQFSLICGGCIMRYKHYESIIA